MQHYFIDQELNLGMELTLPAELYQHAIVVLRKQVGDQFELVDIHQTVSIVTVTQIEKKTAQVKVVEQLDQNAELPVAITIACGLPKNDKKTELIVEKGTEMGQRASSFSLVSMRSANGTSKKLLKNWNACKKRQPVPLNNHIGMWFQQLSTGKI